MAHSYIAAALIIQQSIVAPDGFVRLTSAYGQAPPFDQIGAGERRDGDR